MMKRMTRATMEERAVRAIEQHGALLVYPMGNRADPPSLWSVLHPRTPMRWAWDEGADRRVVALWHLREQLARSRRVVYGKWYAGRAVFFSRALFGSMLVALQPSTLPCSREASELLALLDEDSPRSTKALRAEAGLRGRESERTWTRAMRELWERLLVVGTGEVPDGAFPSLEVGATRWIFEALWDAQQSGAPDAARAEVEASLGRTSRAFLAHWRKVVQKVARAPDDSDHYVCV